MLERDIRMLERDAWMLERVIGMLIIYVRRDVRMLERDITVECCEWCLNVGKSYWNVRRIYLEC